LTTVAAGSIDYAVVQRQPAPWHACFVAGDGTAITRLRESDDLQSAMTLADEAMATDACRVAAGRFLVSWAVAVQDDDRLRALAAARTVEDSITDVGGGGAATVRCTVEDNPVEWAVATVDDLSRHLAPGRSGPFDADEAVERAERAFAVAPAGSAAVLMDALLARSAVRLGRTDEAFATFLERCRPWMTARSALALAAVANPRVAERASADGDVRRALELAAARRRRFPERATPWEAALARTSADAGLGGAAALAWRARLPWYPTDGDLAAETYLRLVLEGRGVEAERHLATCRARGLALPKLSL